MQHNKYKKAKIMKFLTLSRRETQNQMVQLKNMKTSAVNNIYKEILKYGSPKLMEEIVSPFANIQGTEKISSK